MLKLLVNPLARGAYYGDLLEVAEAELRLFFPECELTIEQCGPLTFLNVSLDEEALPELAKMSFVQGIFEPLEEGMRCLDVLPRFRFPEQIVWGAKYRGKTHELVTQMAINIGLKVCDNDMTKPLLLLDPMAGRGTTLFWALRYGLSAWGIEQDKSALQHLQRHVKRQTKLHRLKHKQLQGSIGKRRKDGSGRFLEFQFGKQSLQLVTGDSRDVRSLISNRKFHLLVSDLPYGVQFTSPEGKRNPLEVLKACAPGWVESLRPDGVMVLIFNALQPKREDLIEIFENEGLVLHPFSAPHRMSESIKRDFLVMQRT